MTKTTLAALSALLLAACSTSVPPLPAGAQVTCGSTADCPDGYVCRASIGSCVLPGGDETAPTLVAASLVVTPARVGSLTATVTVAFSVSEPLVIDPQATLSWSGPSGATRALAVVSRDAATHGYVMSYPPVPSGPGADPEGDVSFVATFTDAAGNQGHVELPHVAVFDFTPPALAVDLGGAPISAVSLTPPASSPLRDVTAVTVGTRLRVDFAASEPLAGGAAAPVVTLGSGAAAVTLTQLSGNGLSYVYETVAAAGLPEGPAPLTARLTDLAGNVADVALATVPVVTTRPASPAVATAGAVTYHRRPWGSEATGGAQAYYMGGAAGAVPAGALVVVYSDPTVISAAGTLVGREIARVVAAASGAFGGDVGDPAPFQLFMGDAPDVYVAAVDAAGNVSDADGNPSNGVQAALVRDVAWTATMQGKIPGRAFPNPHAFEGRSVWTPTLAQSGAKPLAAPAEVSRQDGTGASVRGAPHWQPARKYAPLNYRNDLGMAYDPVRGCRVSFSGTSWDGCDSGFYCSQWESCRGSPWFTPTPSDPEGDGNPALGAGLPLVFAGGRGATVLSDGTSLWEWDGTSWRKLVLTGTAPAPRKDHAIAYDEARQRLILFSGTPAAGGASLDETWETDFRSWKLVCPSATCTTRPAARHDHRMVYDSARKVTLLVGGATAGGYDAATWTWNGATWTSACSTGACATASQRQAHGLAFDPVRGKAIAYGGITGTNVYDAGHFEWNGSTWSAVCTSAPCTTTTPTRRAHAAFFHDASRGRTVLANGDVGGFGTFAECISYFCGTEWEWDGAAWSQVAAAPVGPPSVRDVTPVYDPLRDQVVLFGGYTSTGAYSSDTWLWDGGGWTAAAPATVPPGRSQYAAAWMSAANYVAMAGGSNGAAVGSHYIWYGPNSNWYPTFGTIPPARTGSAMAQSTAGGALLFGGRDAASTNLCDTWTLAYQTWSGSATCLTPSPVARSEHAMVRALGFAGAPVLLMGGASGSTGFNDVWSHNGSAWSQVSAGGPASTTQPAPRRGHGLLWDTGRSRVLLWGGQVPAAVSNVNCVDDYGGLSCHDYWEWSGSAWTRVFPIDLYGDGSPAPYDLQGIAFDTSRRLGLGVVASSAPAATMGTWWWSGGPDDRPGQLMSVVFDAAQVTRPFDVLDLDVTWVGGGSGAPGGAVTPGASLQVWDNTAWRPLLASSTASPAALETLHWTLGGDATLGATPLAEHQRFMVGDQRILSFALVPAAPTGSAAGFGQVSTDYAEITVRYRLGAP